MRKRVLAVLKDTEEGAQIRAEVSKEFKIEVISAEEVEYEPFEAVDMVLIDGAFIEECGPDLLKTIMERIYLPVIVLTSLDNAVVAIDAMREGAYNYLMKAGSYLEVLNLVIRDGIAKFGERRQMEETIIALKKRVAELEAQVASEKSQPAEPASQEKTLAGTGASITEEVTSSFKRGEINLPTLPHISTKFRELWSREVELKEVVELLEQDMAICSKLISISNSPYYRGALDNKTLEQAVSRMGLNTTKQYVEVLSNRSLYTTKSKKFVEVMERLWEHSLSCAFASEFIRESCRFTVKDDPFTLGLLHDIGKLLLLQILAELAMKKKFAEDDAIAALPEVFGNYHCQFGSSLLKRWGFSDAFVRVAQHHHDLKSVDMISKELLVVHFANLLVKSLGYGAEPMEIDLAGSDSARLLGLRPETISEVTARVQDVLESELKKCIAA